MAAGIAGGFFVTRYGYFHPPMLVGTVFISIGSGLLSTMNVSTTMSEWVGYQVLTAIGMGESNSCRHYELGT